MRGRRAAVATRNGSPQRQPSGVRCLELELTWPRTEIAVRPLEGAPVARQCPDLAAGYDELEMFR